MPLKLTDRWTKVCRLEFRRKRNSGFSWFINWLQYYRYFTFSIFMVILNKVYQTRLTSLLLNFERRKIDNDKSVKNAWAIESRKISFYLNIFVRIFLKCRPASTRAHLFTRMFLLTCSLSRKAIFTPDDAEVRNVKWAVLSKAKFARRLKFVQRSGSPGLRWRACLFLSLSLCLLEWNDYLWRATLNRSLSLAIAISMDDFRTDRNFVPIIDLVEEWA
jgi:hypothetical protein